MNDGPPAHPKGVPDLMRPQLWIDIRRAWTIHKVAAAPLSAISIENQRTTALLPSLTQLARIWEPRIASDQTRGVCLLCAIDSHPLDLVFGPHVGLENGAVLAPRSERAQGYSGLEHRFAQTPNRPAK